MQENNVNIIELKNLTKTYPNGFTAVTDMNLEIKRGEFVTFLGPSGCGKTTTLRMIAGFEIPTEGKIYLDGRDITSLPPNHRPVNTVFQRYALFPHMNIFDNIAFGLRQKKLPMDEIVRKVKRSLELVDLVGFEERSVSTLSGGQQQRIAIARAVVNQPEILLLDEPLGALDLKMRKEMQLELKSMHEELGITFIYVTHDQEEALTMSDRIVVMADGKIQQVGEPEDIYNEPKNAFVADFIGDSNIFNGIMTGERMARFAGGEFECVDDVEKGTQITAVVRPEDVQIVPPSEGTIKGTVASVVFKGIHYEIAVEFGKNEMVIQSTRSVKVGERVGMKIDPDGIHIMIAEDHTNTFVMEMTKDYNLEYNGHEISVDATKILPGSRLDAEGVLVDRLGEPIDIKKVRVTALIEPDDIEMTDQIEDGFVTGYISNMIYKGDHYSYVVHGDDVEQDFIINDPDLWNMDDHVGLIMHTEKMKFRVGK